MSEEPRDFDESTALHEPRTRLGPTAFVLIGLLVGAVAGFALAWVVGGNPLSTVNEVAYREVIVNSVSADADQLCWADDPERRDSPQTCAILALDPALDVPAPGDTVMIGLVEFDTPDGAEFTQVVHVAPPPPHEGPEEEEEEEDEADADGS
jgi:hypothetical protein